MIGYPPMKELYLGCECMDLDHVALFIHFPPRDDGAKSVIEDEDDAPAIYMSITASNYFTRLLPEIRYLFEKYTWQSFAQYNWYKRLWIAGKYIFNSTHLREYGILDAFDFQEKDHDNLDAFIALISSDIDDNIDEKSELWLDDDRWRMKIQPTRIVFEEHDIVEPWKVGWEIHFIERGFFGRVRWAFKYIFGRHSVGKSFTIYEKDAAKMRGMIKWTQKENKKGEEENKEISKWVVDMSKSEEGVSKMKEALKQGQEENESKSN